jgi:CheY-like chemotaxis protein
MTPYRVFIVDDQTDIRRMLRIGVENLGPDFVVSDMPSAEEALLELMRRPVDLLISDIRLPGISGIELVAKARRRDPNIKIILITALTDSKTRRQAAESGANAFFTKPLDMPDFLDAVERTLGIVETLLPPPPIIPREPAKGPFTPGKSLAERLANLRRDLDASAVILFDDGGQVLAQAGELPEPDPQSPRLLPALMTTISASLKISQSLGMETPRSLMYFPGSERTLCLAHVGPSCALLAVLSPGDEQACAATAGLLGAAVEDLLLSLASLDASQVIPVAEAAAQAGLAPPEEPPLPEASDIPTMEDSAEMARLFQEYTRKLNTRDLNNFWDTAAQESETNGLGNASVISYEQAKKLGLAPKDG